MLAQRACIYMWQLWHGKNIIFEVESKKFIWIPTPTAHTHGEIIENDNNWRLAKFTCCITIFVVFFFFDFNYFMLFPFTLFAPCTHSLNLGTTTTNNNNNIVCSVCTQAKPYKNTLAHTLITQNDLLSQTLNEDVLKSVSKAKTKNMKWISVEKKTWLIKKSTKITQSNESILSFAISSSLLLWCTHTHARSHSRIFHA